MPCKAPTLTIYNNRLTNISIAYSNFHWVAHKTYSLIYSQYWYACITRCIFHSVKTLQLLKVNKIMRMKNYFLEIHTMSFFISLFWAFDFFIVCSYLDSRLASCLLRRRSLFFCCSCLPISSLATCSCLISPSSVERVAIWCRKSSSNSLTRIACSPSYRNKQSPKNHRMFSHLLELHVLFPTETNRAPKITECSLTYSNCMFSFLQKQTEPQKSPNVLSLTRIACSPSYRNKQSPKNHRMFSHLLELHVLLPTETNRAPKITECSLTYSNCMFSFLQKQTEPQESPNVLSLTRIACSPSYRNKQSPKNHWMFSHLLELHVLLPTETNRAPRITECSLTYSNCIFSFLQKQTEPQESPNVLSLTRIACSPSYRNKQSPKNHQMFSHLLELHVLLPTETNRAPRITECSFSYLLHRGVVLWPWYHLPSKN